MDELQTLIDKWDLILSTFKEEHEIIDVSFKTWIKPLKIYKLDGNVLTLTFSSLEDDASTDERSFVYIEKRYLKFLEVTVCEVMNKEYQVIIMSSAEKKEDELKKKTSSVSTDNSLASQNLNPNYTFDTFVIGTNNNLAHAASLAVAETPGQIYNPLFIYGGAGLGKTHLMQAIAHFIIASDPSKKVLYVTSETFTNELIESVKTNKNTEFRNKYRNIDVLLIDDIQFIAGKERCQEEFFHTFNTLYEGEVAKEITVVNNSGTTPADTTPGGTNNSGTTNVSNSDTTNKTDNDNSVTKPGKVKKVTTKVNKKKSVIIKWRKQKAVTGYQIRYSVNKKMKKAKIKTITKNNAKTVLKKLKPGKYFVQIRAYKVVNGKKVAGKWSSKKVVKVSK